MDVKSLLNSAQDYPLMPRLAALPRLFAGKFVREYFPAMSKRCDICGICTTLAYPTGNIPYLQGICAACGDRLQPRITGFCPRCGKLFVNQAAPVTVCLDCRISPPPWQKVLFFGHYDDLLKDLVLRFKFHGHLGLCRFLQNALRHPLKCGIANAHPVCQDLIIPIPLHQAKLRSRGFNQSMELAKGLDCHISGRLNAGALIRTRNTPAQHNLPRSERMRNLKGAFKAQSLIVRGRSILLVDDILTTGATAHAATRALLRAGAREVNLLVLARA